MSQSAKGPLCYENWKAALSGQIGGWAWEFPLFTDGPLIIGELREGIGPYIIINSGAWSVSSKVARAALTIRAQNHLEFELPDMSKTQDGSYHGGFDVDEIAAIISLCLGTRLKAGIANRIFDLNGDPKGRPITIDFSENPIIVRKNSFARAILSNTSTQLVLPEKAKILSTLPLLPAEDAIALVRAARTYQEAVWIAEITPELSWVMLVSAVETIAAQWRSTNSTPIEKVRAWGPGHDLENILRSFGGDQADELVHQVANQIAPYVSATKGFVEFIMTFLPPPPPTRPSLFAQHSWQIPALKKSMNMIYKYRSRALHGGHPFPGPMCEPPLRAGPNDELAEIPLGSSTSMKGAVWIIKDTPMLLHTFEYIVRNAILNWWKSLTAEKGG